MSLTGRIATITVAAATDADVFLACLDHVLCPALTPGDVVVMDNLSSIRSMVCGSGSRRQAPTCFTCRLTHLT